jgi:hypothetical protein
MRGESGKAARTLMQHIPDDCRTRTVVPAMEPFDRSRGRMRVNQGSFKIDKSRHHHFSACVDLIAIPGGGETENLAHRADRLDHAFSDNYRSVRNYPDI